jgi:hypothetical protein
MTDLWKYVHRERRAKRANQPEKVAKVRDLQRNDARHGNPEAAVEEKDKFRFPTLQVQIASASNQSAELALCAFVRDEENNGVRGNELCRVQHCGGRVDGVVSLKVKRHVTQDVAVEESNSCEPHGHVAHREVPGGLTRVKRKSVRCVNAHLHAHTLT